jgi:septation ring formation regulator EzrA
VDRKIMLEDLRNEIRQLIALYENEKHAKQKLAAELAECRIDLEADKNKIAELERQVDNLKLKQAFNSPVEGDSEAKEKIEKMIRQLDKCIAQLEQ